VNGVNVLLVSIMSIKISVRCNFDVQKQNRKKYFTLSTDGKYIVIWVAQVVERRPLDRKVRVSNPHQDALALLLRRQYEFPQCGIYKGNFFFIYLPKSSLFTNAACREIAKRHLQINYLNSQYVLCLLYIFLTPFCDSKV
jgi:hypothetical protein